MMKPGAYVKFDDDGFIVPAKPSEVWGRFMKFDGPHAIVVEEGQYLLSLFTGETVNAGHYPHRLPQRFNP